VPRVFASETGVNVYTCVLIFTQVLQRVHTDFVEVSKNLSRSEYLSRSK